MILKLTTPKQVPLFSIAEQYIIKLRLLKNAYLPLYYTGFGTSKFGTSKFGTASDRVDSQYIQNIIPVGQPPKVYVYHRPTSAHTFGAP